MSALRTPNTDCQSTILFLAPLHIEGFPCMWYLQYLTLPEFLQCKLSCFLLASLTTKYKVLAFSILCVYKISIFQNFVYISSLQLFPFFCFLSLDLINYCNFSAVWGENRGICKFKLLYLTANYHFKEQEHFFVCKSPIIRGKDKWRYREFRKAKEANGYLVHSYIHVYVCMRACERKRL